MLSRVIEGAFFCFERNKENNKKIQKINRKIKKYLEKILTFN
ncbi:hypothetical protein RT42_GL000234 [Enterococcus cecorum DSM 20682 = ATCC 43198]|nr:hypothetical protein RT42_GL000234 [Enterococcus cecorum DSM 20682 = ATCC 43198]